MKLYHFAIFWLALGMSVSGAESESPVIARETIAAAERGEADAQFQLARASQRGEGVPKDVNKAFGLMKLAAEQGHADAIGGLGYFYSVGVAVEKDDKQALEWFRKGAEKGSAKAQLNLGRWLLDGKAGSEGDAEKRLEEGLQWLKKAVDQGLAEANLSYGMIHYFGDHGVAQDYGKAVPCFKLAAAHGLRDAQNFLGVMNEMGLGMPADTAAAQQWYRKAALQGHLRAQANLGILLNPLAENKATRIEALAWLVLASDQNEITAEKSLQDVMLGLKAGELDEARKRAAELRKLIRP